MSVHPGFVEHCMDLCAPAGSVMARRMFGGQGLYVDELFIAILADDTLYLKTDEQTRERFEQAGCRPFEFMRQGARQVTSYWSAPTHALESPRAMQEWVELAKGAARRARAGGRRRAR